MTDQCASGKIKVDESIIDKIAFHCYAINKFSLIVNTSKRRCLHMDEILSLGAMEFATIINSGAVSDENVKMIPQRIVWNVICQMVIFR